MDCGAIFQRLADNLSGLIYRVNLRQNNHIEFLNAQAILITGYSAEELNGGAVCGIASLVQPSDREHVIREVEQALVENRPFAVEYRLRHKDGGERYLLERGLPVNGEDGKPHFIDGVIFDITEGQRTVERFQRRGLLNEQIVNSTGEGIIVYGPDLRYLAWNPAMERISGKKASDVLGRHPLEIFPNLQNVGVIDRLEKTLRGEVCPAIEFHALTVSGIDAWSSDSCSPLYNAMGEIAGVVGVVRDITERKKSEIALLNSENMLKAIIDTEPECVKLIDAEGRLIQMNRAGLEMIQVDSLAQVKGQCVCPLIVAEHWDSFMSLVRRVFQGESGTLVFEIVGAKGRHLWLETHAVPFRNERDEIIALLAVTRDITASRQAQDDLRQSRERYRTLYDETPVMLHSIDRAWGLVDVNQHWLKTMGYERSEVLGRKVTDFYTESSRQYALEVVQPAFFRDGYCRDVPYQFIKKNGEILDVLLSASSDRDADGNVVRSRAVIEDITERKRAEDQLRQSEQLVRSILDNVDEGFVLLDKEYRVLSANRAYCQQNKAGELEVIGRYCYEVAHQYSRPCFEYGEGCVVRHVFETGEAAQSLHTQEDSRGEIRYVETRGFPLFDAAGNLTSAIKVIHDVTDHYRLEAEQIKIEKLEAIGALAGGIAHDFNNLLQGIFGYLAMAKLAIDNRAEALAALEQAEKALGLSTKLTMQLLTFSKGGKPVKKLADIRQVVDNSTKFALSGSRCECHLQMAEDLWLAEVDEGQIGQVIQNIVLNAVQSMTEGGKIEILVGNVEAPGSDLPPELTAGDYLAIRISDNGPGISAQLLGKIFDPYFTTKSQGSGLGLATSYSIIRNHDGLIDVHSETGQGTTFLVYLPAIREESHGALPEPLVHAGEAVAQKSGKILVMDDDQVIRDVAVLMIKALGHEVESAEHGEEAIGKYRLALESGKPFDVVVLDLTIRGGMGGLETIGHLLEIDPGVRAVVSSGYSGDSTLTQYQQLGFVGCLHKPYSLKELEATLKTLV